MCASGWFPCTTCQRRWRTHRELNGTHRGTQPTRLLPFLFPFPSPPTLLAKQQRQNPPKLQSLMTGHLKPWACLPLPTPLNIALAILHSHRSELVVQRIQNGEEIDLTFGVYVVCGCFFLACGEDLSVRVSLEAAWIDVGLMLGWGVGLSGVELSLLFLSWFGEGIGGAFWEGGRRGAWILGSTVEAVVTQSFGCGLVEVWLGGSISVWPTPTAWELFIGGAFQEGEKRWRICTGRGRVGAFSTGGIISSSNIWDLVRLGLVWVGLISWCRNLEDGTELIHNFPSFLSSAFGLLRDSYIINSQILDLHFGFSFTTHLPKSGGGGSWAY
jgi:hypothetical protein